MTHPANRLFCYIGKQLTVLIHCHLNFSVLTDRCLAYMSAQDVHHQLSAIAQSKYRNSHFKQFSAAGRGSLFVTAVGASGKNDSLRIHLPNCSNVGFIGIYFTVNVAFTNTAGYQLIVLAAKINDNDFFSVHELSSYFPSNYNNVHYT